MPAQKETGMNAKNGDLGTGADTEQVKEHLRAAKDAAASAARARAQQARDWASTQIDGLQQRVEELEARIALQEREYLEAPIETD